MDMETNWQELKCQLVSGDMMERKNALYKMKDAIIGSNRRKGELLAEEIVPQLLVLLRNNGKAEAEEEDKMNALIILGSLAKGSNQQVQILVNKYSIIPILVKEIILKSSNSKCIEVCLSIMRSIYEQPYNAGNASYLTDCCPLQYFLSFASAESSLKTQICVTSILVSICQTRDDQMRLLHAGTIHMLARMVCYENEHVQIPALRCLACMCYSNRSVTDNICVTSYHGRSLPDILNSLLSRLYTPEIQLTAAKCLTYIYRSGTLLSTDYRILHKTLPSLTRLCIDNFDISIRLDAADTLAYLIEIDAELQQTAAISNHLLKSLPQLLFSQQSTRKQAALRCYASLCANDEAIRKRIMDTTSLMDAILDSLNSGDSQIRLAAIRCLHSLSRSVQQLRTTFQDNCVWKPLMYILSYESTPCDFLIAITSTICNLLLEFSPSKEPLLNSGIMEKLCCLTEHTNTAVRLNCVWALMNMSFQAEHGIKTDIIDTLGMKRILKLLCDADTSVIMKTLGLLRNLFSKQLHVEQIMHQYSSQVFDSVHLLLDSSHSSKVKEQVLGVLGNIAAGLDNSEILLNDKKIISYLKEYMFCTDNKLQIGSLYVINNIVHRHDSWTEEKYLRLDELEIIKKVHELHKKLNSSSSNIIFYEEYIHRTLKSIIVQCNKICPKIVN